MGVALTEGAGAKSSEKSIETVAGAISLYVDKSTRVVRSKEVLDVGGREKFRSRRGCCKCRRIIMRGVATCITNPCW